MKFAGKGSLYLACGYLAYWEVLNLVDTRVELTYQENEKNDFIV